MLLVVPYATLAQEALPASILQALRQASIPLEAASFYVQEVGMGRAASATSNTMPMLSIRADTPMNPASTMKLVTTYSALELLGPAFTWKTIAASNASLKGDVLDGDLVLKGAGDPKFVIEYFWLMLSQLRAHGVREIRGDLVLDRSLFEATDYDPARFDGESAKPYNVGPDALLLNYKAVTFSFIPDEAHQQIRVATEPQLAGLQIGKLRSSDGPCGDWRTRLGVEISGGLDAAPGSIESIKFTGSYAASCGEKTWSMSLLSHTQYVGAAFRKLWLELGGIWRGKVRDGRIPDDARTLVQHESPSLAEIVRDINKYSNNVMAKQLFLDLSAEVLKLPANTERSQRVVKNFLDSRGLTMPELVLENGSGLSRNERISAQSMARVLLAAWAAPVMPEFMSSLSLVGFDGTMRKRLKADNVAGQAHIKTGTLADVRALAGYVLAASGKRYAVVCFINHANADAGQTVQDAFLQWVFDLG